jgi:hypothetical protein
MLFGSMDTICLLYKYLLTAMSCEIKITNLHHCNRRKKIENNIVESFGDIKNNLL